MRRVDTAIECDCEFTAYFEADIDLYSSLALEVEMAVDLDERVAHGSIHKTFDAMMQITLDTHSKDVTSTAVLRLEDSKTGPSYTGRSTEETLKAIKDARPNWLD